MRADKRILHKRVLVEALYVKYLLRLFLKCLSSSIFIQHSSIHLITQIHVQLLVIIDSVNSIVNILKTWWKASSSFKVMKTNDVDLFDTLLICLSACFLNIELLLLIEEETLVLFINLLARIQVNELMFWLLSQNALNISLKIRSRLWRWYESFDFWEEDCNGCPFNNTRYIQRPNSNHYY